MPGAEATSNALRSVLVALTFVVVALLVQLVFPLASQALQGDNSAYAIECASYNELIAQAPCSGYCDYSYNRFIGGEPCYIYALYDPLERKNLEDGQAGQGRVRSTAAANRPVFEGEAAPPMIQAARVDAVATTTPAASSALAVTGTDDRIPLGGLLLVGLGSFAVAISRRRQPV